MRGEQLNELGRIINDRERQTQAAALGAVGIGMPSRITGNQPFQQIPDVLRDENALDWQNRSLCSQTDPEAFHPEKGGSTKQAKMVCAGCEVRAECLEYALQNGERFGIWGGLSERERRALKKRKA